MSKEKSIILKPINSIFKPLEKWTERYWINIYILFTKSNESTRRLGLPPVNNGSYDLVSCLSEVVNLFCSKSNFLKLFLIFLSFTTTAFKGNSQITTEYKSTEKGWFVKFEDAASLSEKSGKPVMAYFTGSSDWCKPCSRMSDIVFSKKLFKRWANKYVVLLEVNVPSNLASLPKEIVQQNSQLVKSFQVEKFPTIWFFKLKKEKGTYNINGISKMDYCPYLSTFMHEVDSIFMSNAMINEKTKIAEIEKKREYLETRFGTKLLSVQDFKEILHTHLRVFKNKKCNYELPYADDFIQLMRQKGFKYEKFIRGSRYKKTFEYFSSGRFKIKIIRDETNTRITLSIPNLGGGLVDIYDWELNLYDWESASKYVNLSKKEINPKRSYFVDNEKTTLFYYYLDDNFLEIATSNNLKIFE